MTETEYRALRALAAKPQGLRASWLGEAASPAAADPDYGRGSCRGPQGYGLLGARIRKGLIRKGWATEFDDRTTITHQGRQALAEETARREREAADA